MLTAFPLYKIQARPVNFFFLSEHTFSNVSITCQMLYYIDRITIHYSFCISHYILPWSSSRKTRELVLVWAVYLDMWPSYTHEIGKWIGRLWATMVDSEETSLGEWCLSLQSTASSLMSLIPLIGGLFFHPGEEVSMCTTLDIGGGAEMGPFIQRL